MKFLKSHKIVHIDRLFQGKYKYKTVISSGVAGLFRGGNLDRVTSALKNGDFYLKSATVAEKTFASKLLNLLKSLENWCIRVETPYISLYVDNLKSLESIVKLSNSRIKYIGIPDPATESKLASKSVIVKKLDFDFKVTVGSTNQNYISFVNWCENNPKVRLPKRAAKDLSKDYSPGGGYFYVKDDKSLTMVKMFLGRTITKVETVVRA